LSIDWPFEDLAAGPASNVKELTVSELSFALKRTLEENFGLVRVRGEISKVTRPGSGHCYLDIKDDRAVICAVIWKNGKARLGFKPEQGLEVVITGRITTFPTQSRYQIVIDAMEPAGAGALMALLEQRRQKLQAEGLFDVARKKPIPFLPRIIGIVTSPTGAVIRDILHRLSDRFPRHVVIWPVRVQGDRSAGEVSVAIRGFNALSRDGAIPRPELIIVARGGGSIEDLWCFNDEIVVRAAASSTIPLISAIGHETDWTLIDYAADWRAPTPTAAAERAVPVRTEQVLKLAGLHMRKVRALQRFAGERRARILAASRGLPRPDNLLASARQRFDGAAGRLSQALLANTGHHRSRLVRLIPHLSLRPVRHEISRQQTNLAARGRQARRSAGFHVAMKSAAVSSAFTRLSRAVRQSMDNDRAGLSQILPRLSMRTAEQQTARGRATLARHAGASIRAMNSQVALKRRALESCAKLLETLSHHSVLGRGYALVMSGGRLVPGVGAARPGLAVTIRFHDGETGARIDGHSPAASRAGGKKVPDQGSLF
jgi:exodeoxyribonuclease VII large subunit